MSVPVHSAPTVQTSSVCKTAPLYMPADGRIALNSPQASIEMPADQAAILQLDVGQLAEQEVTSKSSKGKHAAGSNEPGLNSHKRHRPEEQVQMSQEPLGLTAASPAAQSMVAPKAGRSCQHRPEHSDEAAPAGDSTGTIRCSWCTAWQAWPGRCTEGA